MRTNRCLYCYGLLSEEELSTATGKEGFHVSCSKRIFGKTVPPELPYTEDDMLQLAEQIIKSRKTVPGVQPKLSLSLLKNKKLEVSHKFTIVELWGEYILKPQTRHYRHLPELEDLTMHLARASKINTVDHTLIYLKSGQLAYITKRVDRNKGMKLHMEDMCQLTERLTEHKYKGSYEQIARAILRYSANPGLDVIDFYEQVIFSFLTGNNDMHLKNFSLLRENASTHKLCPAYDLVASELVVEGDDEELALNLNGKKKRLNRKDFEMAMGIAGIEEKSIDNVFKNFFKVIPKWHDLIEISFLPEDLKELYHLMVERKQKQIAIG